MQAEAAEPFKLIAKRVKLGHRVGTQILIVSGGIFPEQVTRQPAHQSTHAIFQSGDRRSSKAQARHGAEGEIVEPREIWRCTRLPFGELESGTEIRMSREQFAFLARWRRETIAPERDVIVNGSEFRTRRQIGVEAGGEDDEVEDECTGSGFDDGPFRAVADL